MIRTKKQFLAAVAECPPGAPVVADCETAPERLLPNGRVRTLSGLLGVAVTWKGAPAPLWIDFADFDKVSGKWGMLCESGLPKTVGHWLQQRKLIGHGCMEFDRPWLDDALEITTQWHACTRIMWFLADWNQSPANRGYGLKTAETRILKWPESNAVELADAVKAAGGNIKNGDHYLAPRVTLARYAKLDAKAELELYEHFEPFFKTHDYWGMLSRTMNYARFMSDSTSDGVLTSREQLTQAAKEFTTAMTQAARRVASLCSREIRTIEAGWKVAHYKSLKSQRGKDAYLAGQGAPFRRFNPNSGDQVALLMHNHLGLPVTERTPTGKPKTDRATVRALNHPAAQAFAEHSEWQDHLEKCNSYLEGVQSDGRVHFPYNVCGTITGRLSGYKPYALNMPFDCEPIMRAFSLPQGWIGYHSDLKSIEPCLIAALSGDPTLLKVYKTGHGDVYLDLALKIFPDDEKLHRLYDPNVPCTEDVKRELKDLRSVCKIVHLAVGYTGTAWTVSHSLTKAGFPTDEEKAIYIVNRYWDLFESVRELGEKLKAVHAKRGFIRNLYGRILHVPARFEKDTLNRVIQSSGHDVLVHWNEKINLIASTRHVTLKSVLPDLHDATNRMAKLVDIDETERIFSDALSTVNQELDLPVVISAEGKKFQSLFGLKNRE